MKKLLATTAVALVAMASTASAQSVLERVLSQIDNSTNLASVNGTFANIAENIGTAVDTQVTVYASNSTGVALTEEEYAAALAAAVNANWSGLVTSAVNVGPDGVAGGTDDFVEYTVGTTKYTSAALAEAAARDSAQKTYAATFTVDTITVAGGAIEGINGSINNVIDGITDVTQQATAGTVTAIEYNMPTFDFGDMATTALGAVNTGEITLGVNSSVDNAKTSTTEALSSVMTQMGGSADTGALVLNVASNMTGINGSINNTMQEINGSMGNLSTTALGAVNTGTIISGVNAAVNGITGASAGQ